MAKINTTAELINKAMVSPHPIAQQALTSIPDTKANRFRTSQPHERAATAAETQAK
jgi:hypothetical protein